MKEPTPTAYRMKISRLTVNKLGVQLYDKASAVLAELVANGYDADAKSVIIRAPMNRYLATTQNGTLVDHGFCIEVIDDGIGMTPDQVQEFYLKVGGERRTDLKRGSKSHIFERKVMGRKGVGKLAPFGICEKIELISSGGEEIDGTDENGQTSRGFLTAHLHLDRTGILTDSDSDYEPVTGKLDGTVQKLRGTILRMTNFLRKQVPASIDLNRQLSQRFGIQSENWRIVLANTEDNPITEVDVGSFNLETMEQTKLIFKYESNAITTLNNEHPKVFNEKNEVYSQIEAGFYHEEVFYPVTGWVAYSKEPYKDDLMAGIRIYCNGKIAAQTSIFNRKAGFTGEHSIRSYLIGSIDADWLDDGEDLIQTDRRDILWSHEIGIAFEKWGQNIITHVGKSSREPLKRKTWDIFRENSRLEERILSAYPLPEQKEIRENAVKISKLAGQSMREEELQDQEKVESIVTLSLTLAPHITLDEALHQAASDNNSPLSVIANILKIARVAELSSFGRIADERIKVIEKLELLKDNADTPEDMLQKIIAEAPWLIDPQWSPITSNRAFTTLKVELEKYISKEMGEPVKFNDFEIGNKRPDFVLSDENGILQLIEIKKPDHDFQDEELVRLNRYADLLDSFFNDPANLSFRHYFSTYKMTLVCERIKLNGVNRRAFDGLISSNKLIHINWSSFLLKTKNMHKDFLSEAERQKLQTPLATIN